MSDVDPRLQEHRDVWKRKPGLRAIYVDYHHRLLSELPVDELILEIGGGSGNFSETACNLISVDLVPSPWVDVSCDAHALPIRDASFGGIVMLDVLHHLARPVTFFEEAARVLRSGGRLAMIEPAITPLSWPFYHFLHQEPVDMSVDPLADQPPEVAADPFLSNQGIPTLLFGRQDHRARFEARFPEFKIVDRRTFSLFAYPMSGGFKRWSLLPGWAAPPLLKLEDGLSSTLGPILGFRMSATLERL
jgi:SAM-dependent methyltransferase